MRRYNKIQGFLDVRKEKVVTRRRTVQIPELEPSDSDIYLISQRGDRLDILAARYLGRSTYWWVIAHANNIGKGTFIVEPGIQLRIPSIETVRKFETEYEEKNN